MAKKAAPKKHVTKKVSAVKSVKHPTQSTHLPFLLILLLASILFYALVLAYQNSVNQPAPVVNTPNTVLKTTVTPTVKVPTKAVVKK